MSTPMGRMAETAIALRDRAAAAESRVADLEATVRRVEELIGRWKHYQLGEFWRDYAYDLERALVGDETPGTGERA